MSQSPPTKLSPEAELLREFYLRHEAKIIDETPVQPMSTEAKARLIATFKKYGVTPPAALMDAPTKLSVDTPEAFLALARGAVDSLTVAASLARRWLSTLIEPPLASAARAMRTGESTTWGVDHGTTNSTIVVENIPSEDETKSNTQPLPVWTLVGLDRDTNRADVLALTIRPDQRTESATAVRVLGWTQEAKDRLMKVNGEVIIKATDVHLLPLLDHETLGMSEREIKTIKVTIPQGYRWASGNFKSVRIPRDEDGALLISILIKADSAE